MNDKGAQLENILVNREAPRPVGEDAIAIAQRVRSGALTPMEVVKSFQARIEIGQSAAQCDRRLRSRRGPKAGR